MRWMKVSFGVAVLALLSLNLRAQLATQRKLDALAVAPQAAPVEIVAAALVSNDDAYVIEAPDILVIAAPQFAHADGKHLVRPDGTISLGTFGTVEVAGLTVAAARAKIEEHLSRFGPRPTAAVRVDTANSKCVYVITDTAGSGGQVVRVPLAGNETVLDAVAAAGDGSTERTVSVARKSPVAGEPWQVLPVDWKGIKGGATATNYQLLPGDRVYLAAK